MSRKYHGARSRKASPAKKRYKGSKTLLQELSDCLIYIVDGTALRRELDPQYIMGSNFKANPEYIPEGEIWIEEMLSPAERFFICLHEVFEMRHMVKGMSYEKAHDLASQKESKMRKKWKAFRFLGDDWPMSLDLPGFFPKKPR
jgi:hypothetical protein